jgi:small subunit ribosomal protein S13
MVRISGVEIPADKKTIVALTSIYGVGKNNVYQLLKKANIDFDKKVKSLTEQEVVRLQKAIDSVPTEGILRKRISENIKRLQQIGSYRGKRHAARLPVRGQRTRCNARTKRGKRVTIGAMKKDLLQRTEKAKKGAEKDKGKDKS